MDGITNDENLIINGWAFIEDEESSNSLIHITLESEKNNYILKTNKIKRVDVSKHYNNNKLNDSGFSAYINKKDVVSEYIKLASISLIIP